MTTFIDVEDIDTMNLRMFHELTIIEFNIIQFLQHLQLLPTKPKDTDGCNKKCNDWYRAYVEKRGDEGYLFRCRQSTSTRCIRNGTFFANSKLILRQIFGLIYYWARKEDSLKQ
ncbi:unnamed protein product [Rotaria magnacalcarata]|uniref:Uncharacterized protein n=1 Tax=Rotaria magnacalcarata TaxID=392030 RepID=A0A816MXW2_9BILA|nr:unnamed protein product [Rotaria magnacalcarata]